MRTNRPPAPKKLLISDSELSVSTAKAQNTANLVYPTDSDYAVGEIELCYHYTDSQTILVRFSPI